MSAHRSFTSLTDDEAFPLKTVLYREFSMADYSELVDFATAVFGSRDAANTWLNLPAIALDQQRPIDVFPDDPQLVLDVLGRIQYGVY